MIHAWTSTAFAYRLGWTLLHSLWEGAAVAAILVLFLSGLSRRSAHVRYMALVVAMCAIVAGCVVTFIVGPGSELPPRSNPGELTSADPGASQGADVRPYADDIPVLTLVPHPTLYSTPLASRIRSLLPPLATTWLAGVLLLALWRAAGWLSVQRLRVIKTEPVDSAVWRTAGRLAQRINLTGTFDVLVSHFTPTPIIVGWFRPVILIPAAAITGLTPTQLEGILAHELAHIRRHDYPINLLQIVAETLLFYHPAVWWISHHIRLEREQACDDIAISVCADRRDYARSLVALEELRLTGAMVLAAHGSGGRQLLIRIRRIIAPAAEAPRLGLRSVVSFLIFTMTAGALYSQVQVEPQPAKPSGGQNMAAAPSTRPFSLQNNAPRLSPFTAVRWHGDVPEVQYNGTWHELLSIDDVPPSKIMDFLQQSNDFAPRKHFAEDLVEVMRDMGQPLGNTVKLEMRTLDTRQLIVVSAAAMTEENRKSVLANGNPATAPALVFGAPRFSLRNNAPTLSPFTAVRWSGDVPQVQYKGTWYDLLSINDVPASKIMDYLQQSHDFAPRKHFAEDLVEVMRDMGQPLGNTVKLEMKTLDTRRLIAISAAAMSEENRQSVLANGNPTTAPSDRPGAK